MSEKRDYYEVLGVSKNASDADIKKVSLFGGQFRAHIVSLADFLF